MLTISKGYIDLGGNIGGKGNWNGFVILISAWFFINDFNGWGLSKLMLIGTSDLRYEKHIMKSRG
jgi:hypothetical protein